MKISKALLGAIGVGLLACLLIAGTILALHRPIVRENGWNGVQPVSTTTPTAAIFPTLPSWAKTMLPISPLPTLPARTPLPTWSPLPGWTATSLPTSTPQP